MFIQFTLFLLVSFLAFTASAKVLERRNNPFPTKEAWDIFPAPFSAPGLGSGQFVAGLWSKQVTVQSTFYFLSIKMQ